MFYGELAQLVECCDRTAEVRGSSLLFSIYVHSQIEVAATIFWSQFAYADGKKSQGR